VVRSAIHWYVGYIVVDARRRSGRQGKVLVMERKERKGSLVGYGVYGVFFTGCGLVAKGPVESILLSLRSSSDWKYLMVWARPARTGTCESERDNGLE
jgi:coproporphyrinogen III oxidase